MINDDIAEAKRMMEGIEARAKTGGPIACQDIAILALIRAVELLATEVFVEHAKKEALCLRLQADVKRLETERDDARGLVRQALVAADEPSKSAGAFDDGLVERLAAKAGVTDDPVRTIISELAAMPVELPDAGEMLDVYFKRGTERESNAIAMVRLHEELTTRLAPILAAKDAERERLQRSVDHYKASFETKSARALELEKAANESAFELGQAIARIAELEKRFARVLNRVDHGPTDNWRGEIRNILAGKMAEQVPVDATGKTPGRVVYEARNQGLENAFKPWAELDEDLKPRWEAAAQAVLRAFPTRVVERVTVPMSFDFYFGDLVIPGHISPDELQAMIEAAVGKQVEAHAKTFERDGNQRAAEVLEKVRERLNGSGYQPNDDDDGEVVDLEHAIKVIDDEIKSITDPQAPQTHHIRPGDRLVCVTDAPKEPPGGWLRVSITDPQKPTKPAEITDTTKPTKPLTAELIAETFAGKDWGANDLGCAKTALGLIRERVEKLASYWEKGATHESMHEQYRKALADCAKELREELSK